MLDSKKKIQLLVAKMKENMAKSEVFRIKGAAIDFRILEGEEETEYLEHSLFWTIVHLIFANVIQEFGILKDTLSAMKLRKNNSWGFMVETVDFD